LERQNRIVMLLAFAGKSLRLPLCAMGKVLRVLKHSSPSLENYADIPYYLLCQRIITRQ
jgi:hypothetical protein